MRRQTVRLPDLLPDLLHRRDGGAAGCESAWGPGADLRPKPLKCLASPGAHGGDDSQGAQAAAVQVGRRGAAAPVDARRDLQHLQRLPSPHNRPRAPASASRGTLHVARGCLVGRLRLAQTASSHPTRNNVANPARAFSTSIRNQPQDHPARRPALSAVHLELPRCRGIAGRTRPRHLL